MCVCELFVLDVRTLVCRGEFSDFVICCADLRIGKLYFYVSTFRSGLENGLPRGTRSRMSDRTE